MCVLHQNRVTEKNEKRSICYPQLLVVISIHQIGRPTYQLTNSSLAINYVYPQTIIFTSLNSSKYLRFLTNSDESNGTKQRYCDSYRRYHNHASKRDVEQHFHKHRQKRYFIRANYHHGTNSRSCLPDGQLQSLHGRFLFNRFRLNLSKPRKLNR